MHRVAVTTLEEWRAHARRLLAADVEPGDVSWDDALQPSLFGDATQLAPSAPKPTRARVPKAFLDAAEVVACHRDGDRFDLLYRVLFRLTHGEPELLEVAADPDTLDLLRRKAAVLRDVHKTHAFVRFRKLESPAEGAPEYVAWHEPAHRCLRLAAPFFARRFPAMRWAILTREASVVWNLHALEYGPGAARSDAPQHDDLEELFSTYWRSIYNPARINLAAMKKEMPVRHWATIPETASIPELVRDSVARVQTMGQAAPSAASLQVPATRSLSTLREAAAACTACELHRAATQTVFGEGPERARVMLVGEQPGDEEDRRGRPFVGPAGRLLDRLLQEAGVPRDETYVTNAVKHFKFEPRGQRRIHAKPSYTEAVACRGWLDAEIAAVQPEVIVCLGATAAQSFMGRKYALTRSRGTLEATRFASHWIATWHPSAVLRAVDEPARERLHADLVADLRRAYAALG